MNTSDNDYCLVPRQHTERGGGERCRLAAEQTLVTGLPRVKKISNKIRDVISRGECARTMVGGRRDGVELVVNGVRRQFATR